ncbi:DUF5819 family protein [Streptomyces sp. NPDC058257]|uniref:DUF5819 family protein n=1 Tax=Streptomyces sp. NPDC058257 TaxID=3346409 RepID=UPI0036E1CA4A
MDAIDNNANEPPIPPADLNGPPIPPADPNGPPIPPTDAHGRTIPPIDAPSPPGTAAAPPQRTGLAALSPRYQVAGALAMALIAVTACVHAGMLFLHVAPSNTMTKQHGQVVDDWVYPEFEQNWKLFAPNPMQQNIAVQARAEIRTDDGTTRTTGWYDLSARDGAAIDGNLLPSHTQQNELRRAWDFYVGAHDAQNRPRGLRGELSERYIRRIVVMRVEREESMGRGATIERVQVRSRTTNVTAPEWSDEKVNTKPVLRQLSWWSVTSDDMPLGKAQGSEGDAR